MTNRLNKTELRVSDVAVRLMTVREVTRSLRALRDPAQVTAMRSTLNVWNPLYDRLIALWCSTVDGELPWLDENGAVRGGLPCTVWPPDWAWQRERWLTDYRTLARTHGESGRHAHPRSNFIRLRNALMACASGSDGLRARDIGWIRRALANTLRRHGAPGSPRRTAVRAEQAANVRVPTRVALAGVLADRLSAHPAGGGVPELAPLLVPVSPAESEATGIPAGTAIPASLRRRAARPLAAPVEELVRHNVITAGESLATVLPQLAAAVADIDDPVVAGMDEQIHAARQGTMLALAEFPHVPPPTPLITELDRLARNAGLALPLLALPPAHVLLNASFTFPGTWRTAAAYTAETLADTLYSAYYDLSENAVDRFHEMCRRRAAEAGWQRHLSAPADARTVLEQARILIADNLAVLVHSLELTDWLTENAPELADRALVQVVCELGGHTRVERMADAWRQAIFLLSHCPSAEQREALSRLSDVPERFAPAVAGLRNVLDGGRFTEAGATAGGGRRFLGAAVGRHWVRG